MSKFYSVLGKLLNPKFMFVLTILQIVMDYPPAS